MSPSPHPSPLVSVVCYSYNHEEYIKETILAIIHQVVDFDFEIIVHDDASTDSTQDIIKDLAFEYPNLLTPILRSTKVFGFHGGPKGPYILSLAGYLSGMYIAICDGDDLWNDTFKLSKQVSFLESNHDHAMCLHSALILDVNTNSTRVLRQSKSSYDVGEVLNGGGGGGQFFAASSIMFRSTVLENIPVFFRVAPNGDTSLAMLCGLYGKIGYIDQVMCMYRFGTKSSWSVNAWTNQRLRLETIILISSMYRLYDIQTNYVYSKYLRQQIAQLSFIYLVDRLFYAVTPCHMRRYILSGLTFSYRLRFNRHRFFSSISRIFPFSSLTLLRRSFAAYFCLF